MTDVIERKDRAVRSQAALEVCGEAFDKIRAAMLDQAVKTPIRDAEAREKLILGVQALDAVREQLRSAVQDGEILTAMENNEEQDQ